MPHLRCWWLQGTPDALRRGSLTARLAAYEPGRRSAIAPQARPQVVDLVERLLERAGRVDHDVGDAQPRLVGDLRGDAGGGIRSSSPRSSTSRRLRTSAGAWATTMSSHGSLSACLDEQRHVVDDDRVGIGRERLANRRRIPLRTAGCTIAFSRCTASGSPNTRAPSAARSSEPSAAASVAELRGDRREHRGSRLLHVADDLIRVDDDGTVLGEATGDRGLSRGDAAGERDEGHESRMPCPRSPCCQSLDARTWGPPEGDLSLA